MAEPTSLSTEIVERVAAREGVDPLDLDAKLYDVIDGDALDALADSVRDRRSENLLVQFTYLGYTVTVDGGEVAVDRQASGTDETSTEE